MKILSFSPVVPYDDIGHAGGKTYNYYIKQLCNKPDIELSLLCFASRKEQQRCDLDKYGIDHEIILSSGSLRSNIEHAILDLLSAKHWRYKNYSAYKHHKIMQHLRKLEKRKQLPDIIELEWTNFVLSAPAIRQKYPQIKLIASEHDVSFLGAERRYLEAEGKKQQQLKKQFLYLKKTELEALQCCDVVMPQSEKDKDLLVSEDIPADKIHVLTPYYHDMSGIIRGNINHDILFWGAMYRQENYEAALWFIDNVMPLLEDTDIRFIVAGNRPPEVLKQKANDRIIITGFVKDEVPYFANSLCFVSPLQLGAGIKVKVIEAMSARIPVLTNKVGIEGIPAQNGISYFHCEQPEEYATIIKKLIANEIDLNTMAAAQTDLLANQFGLEFSFMQYLSIISELVTER